MRLRARVIKDGKVVGVHTEDVKGKRKLFYPIAQEYAKTVGGLHRGTYDIQVEEVSILLRPIRTHSVLFTFFNGIQQDVRFKQKGGGYGR